MKCVECGNGQVRRRKTVVKTQFRGVPLEVPGIAQECNTCGFQVIPLDVADDFGQALEAAYRNKVGLLTSSEIRQARQRLNMIQRQFAEYLGVGDASIKRWELGALLDRSSDDLIRLKMDPDFARRSLEQLCHRLGQKPPAEPERTVVFVQGPA